MIIFLRCEGDNDYAVIPHFIRRVSNIQNLEIQWIKNDVLKKFKTHRKSNIVITSHYKLIKALAAFALSKNSKCIAIHQDADGKYAEVYASIVSEFQLLSKDFRCLAIVPKEMIESWLLADITAINSLGVCNDMQKFISLF